MLPKFFSPQVLRVLSKALADANIRAPEKEIDAIAFTKGPGMGAPLQVITVSLNCQKFEGLCFLPWLRCTKIPSFSSISPSCL